MQHQTMALAPRQLSNTAINEPWETHRRYGIVIDAGSSGSRVYVYSWKDHDHVKSILSVDDLKGSIPIVERGDEHGLKWTRREEPGISTYGSRPQEVGEHLKLLLDFASEVVPPEHQSSTPIFLMATAGMRLLPDQERNAVLNATCSYIQQEYPFHLPDCEQHIRVIPGELEGIYGWVAVNYLMGGFDTSIQAITQDKENDNHHTFGFLDMGGASAQIAFEPEHHQRQEHLDDLSRIYLHTLDGHRVEYDVFVTTFLGYGSNEARRRYLEERVRQAHEQQANDGKNRMDQHHTLHLDDPCLPYNLTLADTHSTSVPLTLHGTGSFNECIDATAPLLNKDAECPTQPCLFNGVHTPHIDWSVNKFVGISEYWYSSHDILGLGGVYDFTEYENKSTEYCATDWAQWIDTHKQVDPSDILHHQMQCFKSAWIVNVLHDGIGIPRMNDPAHNDAVDDEDLFKQSVESIESKNWNPPFQSIDTINDIQVSWTLGAMVLHVTNQIPLDDTDNKYHDTDDEGAHAGSGERVADGVELPSELPHHHYPDNAQQLLGDMSPSFNNTLLLLAMLCIVAFFWCLYKRTGRKRRSMDESRWDGLLGGTSGNNGSGSSPYVIASSLATALSRSTFALRTWASRLLRHTSPPTPAMPTTTITTTANMDMANDQLLLPPTMLSSPALNDSVAINMSSTSHSATNSPTLRPAFFSPASRSHSATNIKAFNKKRYSGDSNTSHLFAPPTTADNGSGRLPLRSSSSAVNLANRANITPTNTMDDS
ncbi:hypothetical protein K492DRAFT_147220 [Lichtheimia hyalospora FSU 10163]|nr:hypothetical protein K492DRAFT_147220 [Lichtheimia hyalospora FSU 10163]